jgi:membrane-associated phospholipid phosphatase
MASRGLAAALGVAVFGVPRPVAAEQPPSAETRESVARAEQQIPLETDRYRLKWAFPHFRLWQGITSALATGTSLFLQIQKYKFPGDRWRGPILFDEPVYDAIVEEDESDRLRADQISDYLWHGSQYYAVAESLIVPLVFDHGNTEVAAQMTLINWQVLGWNGLLTRFAHIGVRRARPPLPECIDDPESDSSCTHTGSSFFSGHTSMSTAAAAVTCSHHAALPLFGDGPWNFTSCVVLSGSAATVGFLRIRAAKHWPTDVVFGYLLGSAVGIGVPWLLHYGQRESPMSFRAGPMHGAVFPWASETQVGISAYGTF